MAVGDSPSTVVVGGALVFVANNGDDTVSVLRRRGDGNRDDSYRHPATRLAVVAVGSGPFGMVVRRAQGALTLWVASFGADSVVVTPLDPITLRPADDGRPR
jgi:DNA-binding beta-propeller fold protein YncE